MRTKSVVLVSALELILLAAGCGTSADRGAPVRPTGGGVYLVTLSATTPSGLPKCSSALAGTTASVTSPPGLFTCIGDTWVPLPCTTALGGAVAYASASKALWACVHSAWTQVAVPSGSQGPAGPKGARGDAGVAGATSLVALLPFSGARGNCTTGGTQVQSGVDSDGDGVLDSAEVSATAYVCDGSAGAPGAPGAPGKDGATGPAGPAGNDGAPGAAGKDGASSLIAMTPEAAGANCATGGTRIDAGVDVNGDGVLAGDEVRQTSYVCNGPNEPVPPPAPDAGTCAVDVLFLVDRSGSMGGNLEAGATAKWQAIGLALESFVGDPGNASLNVGLQYFPHQDASGSDSCSQGDYATPAVPMGPASMASDAFASVLDVLSPAGGAPTQVALLTAINYAAAKHRARPLDKVHVVLITDGLSTECDTIGTGEDGLMTIAGQAPSQGVRLSVIGVDSAVNSFGDSVARLGGGYYALAANLASLVDAVNSFSSQANGCQ